MRMEKRKVERHRGKGRQKGRRKKKITAITSQLKMMMMIIKKIGAVECCRSYKSKRKRTQRVSVADTEIESVGTRLCPAIKFPLQEQQTRFIVTFWQCLSKEVLTRCFSLRPPFSFPLTYVIRLQYCYKSRFSQNG